MQFTFSDCFDLGLVGLVLISFDDDTVPYIDTDDS
jgi:hypothetical protein